MRHRTLYYLPLLLAALLPFPSQLCAQGTVFFSEPVSISTEGNHALPEMLERIQHLYSTAIDFEEAPIEYSADMVVSPVFMKSGGHPVFVKGGELTVQLDKTDRTAYQAVQTVLAAYTNSGLPGLYQATDEGERVDVVPVEARSVAGTMRRVTPIMDSPISLNYQPRQITQLLQDIAAAISKVSGYKVYLSATGVNDSMDPPTDLTGFSGEKARDAFAKSVALSYQVLFDPGEKAYYLNMAPVALPSSPASATPRTPSLTRSPKTSPFWVKK